MKFEVVGPFFVCTQSIIKVDDIKSLKAELDLDSNLKELLSAPGCYVFGVKSSGSKRVVPWYVGKAERQSVFKEATNKSHLQLFNEVLDKYENGVPAFIFLPQVTATGRPTSIAKGERGKPAVEFLENWLISASLNSNPKLVNVQKTKMLSDLWVRGLFNPTQGDSNSASTALKAALRL